MSADREAELADATELVIAKVGGLRQAYDGALATIRVHEHTIRLVSTARDEAAARISTLESRVAELARQYDADLARASEITRGALADRDAAIFELRQRMGAAQAMADGLLKNRAGAAALAPEPVVLELHQPAVCSHPSRDEDGRCHTCGQSTAAPAETPPRKPFDKALAEAEEALKLVGSGKIERTYLVTEGARSYAVAEMPPTGERTCCDPACVFKGPHVIHGSADAPAAPAPPDPGKPERAVRAARREHAAAIAYRVRGLILAVTFDGMRDRMQTIADAEQALIDRIEEALAAARGWGS